MKLEGEGLLVRMNEVARRVLRPPAREAELPAGLSRRRPVVFICAEYGIHESLPLYSGGLGVLAGDHLKAASGLGVPLVVEQNSPQVEERQALAGMALASLARRMWERNDANR